MWLWKEFHCKTQQKLEFFISLKYMHWTTYQWCLNKAGTNFLFLIMRKTKGHKLNRRSDGVCGFWLGTLLIGWSAGHRPWQPPPPAQTQSCFRTLRSFLLSVSESLEKTLQLWSASWKQSEGRGWGSSQILKRPIHSHFSALWQGERVSASASHFCNWKSQINILIEKLNCPMNETAYHRWNIKW